MGEEQAEQVRCQICQQMKDLDEVWPGDLIRAGIIETIRKKYPDWDDQGYICHADLNHFRGEYVEDVLEEEMGQISILHEEVLESLKEHEILSKNINLEFEQELTVWERASDKLAAVGGSWRFILGFAVVIGI